MPKSAITPTQRSLKLLRSQGWTVAIVERWNSYARIRQDLFGFIDLLAVGPDGTMAVQTTSGDHVAERVEKILAEPRARACAAAGWQIVVHGWRKVGDRGKRKLWDVRVVPVKPEPLREGECGTGDDVPSADAGPIGDED